MKINPKVLSIPPYVSTAWKNVISLHLEERNDSKLLIIGLVNGSTIEIPNLDKTILDATFAAHQKFLEQENATSTPQKDSIHPPIFGGLMEDPSSLISLPLQFGLDSSIGNMLQHNPEASDTPSLPHDVLEKISTLSKVVGFENSDNFPKPEPHCNCVHCQVMRVIQDDIQNEEVHTIEEEEVTDDELTFREWDIEKTGDNLYLITNPLNAKEQYSVFLGSPVGCTCGEKNCEHIRAVLNS